MAVAGQLPERLGSTLLDAARAAFTQGLQLTFAISAAVVVGMAVLVVALLRHVAAGAEPEGLPAPSQDGSCCAGKVGVVKVSKASKATLAETREGP